MVSTYPKLTYIDRKEVPLQVARDIHMTHMSCESDFQDQVNAWSLGFYFLGRPKLARRFLFAFNPNDRLAAFHAHSADKSGLISNIAVEAFPFCPLF